MAPANPVPNSTMLAGYFGDWREHWRDQFAIYRERMWPRRLIRCGRLGICVIYGHVWWRPSQLFRLGAGIPVRYCAETFENDGSLPSMIMKALKRSMAAEYSRELSVKVYEGQKRIAQLGFKNGVTRGMGFVAWPLLPMELLSTSWVPVKPKAYTCDRVVELG